MQNSNDTQTMSSKDELQREFEHYVNIADSMPPQAADNMLIAYAYYKQACHGDDRGERPTESSNVVQTFKYDAWQRLDGMSKDEAKKKYIEVIKKLLQDKNQST